VIIEKDVKRRIYTKGINVFGNKDKFIIWLNTPCLVIGNKHSQTLLKTKDGCEMILDTLGKIEHGIFN
jgi:putative toxin-antitoxin system antitoxin component (TIGR02293 family)